MKMFWLRDNFTTQFQNLYRFLHLLEYRFHVYCSGAERKGMIERGRRQQQQAKLKFQIQFTIKKNRI